MASSQVQFASSFQFDCVPPVAACHENIKSFEKDNLDDSWVSRVSKNNLGTLRFNMKKNLVSGNEKEDSSLSALMSPRHSTTVKNHHLKNHNDNHKENPLRCSSFVLRSSQSCAPADDSSSVADISHLAASSLVRIWEKRLHHQSNETQTPTSPVASSPTPRIRGRRDFNELLIHLENERYRELNDLALAAPVSKFTKRGRIQVYTNKNVVLLVFIVCLLIDSIAKQAGQCSLIFPLQFVLFNYCECSQCLNFDCYNAE
ncbi:hypothetical protein PIB30_047031 [Stylosanthes scabra]|uniref:Uncharacterized protein n=1 Tax=Stylosanthes scabra TaxID=79078 RepID=A0ABU6QGC4_9FABA|nr:hypothetical protein [Stylosanthes scabra]